MLTAADEYPYHQIARTFSSVQTSDKHWNDGHYICLCDADGKINLISVVRNYQNNDVIDGFVCIRHEGKQHNIRLSRRLRPDMDSFGVGPLRIDILEPMKSVRLVLEDNEYNISCDIVCTTTAIPYEDPVSVTWMEDRLVSERAVYEVVGTCEGHVTVGDKTVELSSDRSAFFRNHSWGTMPGRGGPREHGAPPANPRAGAGLRNWVLYYMPDHAGFYEFSESAEGLRRSTKAAILLPDRQLDVASVEHSLEFYEGTTRIKGGSFTIEDEIGKKRTFEMDDLGYIYCQGGGYFGGFDDGLGQGAWRGEYHVEGETWDASHPVNLVREDGTEFAWRNAWAESFLRLRSDDGQVGYAHFECVTLGEYKPYGLVSEKGI